MLKRLTFLFTMLLLIVVLQATGQSYVVEKVCVGSQRQYRIDGEPGSTYLWQLSDAANNPVTLITPEGIPFNRTNPDGTTTVGSQISINWNQVGKYDLLAFQYTAFGCDTLQHGQIEVFDQPTAFAGYTLNSCSGSGRDN